MTTAPPTADLTDEQKRNKASNAALQKLRQAHPEEYVTLMKAETSALGLAWEPRKSKEDRELDTLRELAKRHPEALAELTQTAESDPTP